MIPDVLGLPLAEARARLQAAAVEPVIEIHTRPPRNPVCGETRVLRQRLLESGIELTIAEFPVLSLH